MHMCVQSAMYVARLFFYYQYIFTSWCFFAITVGISTNIFVQILFLLRGAESKVIILCLFVCQRKISSRYSMYV